MRNVNDAEVTRLLAAIGDPARLQVLLMLKHRGRMNVNGIASNFKLSRPTVSHHLRVLKDADMVCSEKVGQEVYYTARCDHLVTVLRDLLRAIDPPQH
jgi:ArsR family transcriptional regulator, arsenate/arsenite/antimonite-responsive transcriptional repressor